MCFFGNEVFRFKFFCFKPQNICKAISDRGDYMNMRAVCAIIAIWKPGAIQKAV